MIANCIVLPLRVSFLFWQIPVTTCNTRPAAHPVSQWSDDVVAVNTTTNHQISYKSSANLWLLWTPTVNTYKKACDKAIRKTKTRANKARTSREVSVGAQTMFKHGDFRFIIWRFSLYKSRFSLRNLKYGVQKNWGPRPLRFKVKLRVELMRVKSKFYCTWIAVLYIVESNKLT